MISIHWHCIGKVQQSETLLTKNNLPIFNI
ncbi:hypothetical protein EMIT0P2_10479 [Pseudomonas sp. IT-P2]